MSQRLKKLKTLLFILGMMGRVLVFAGPSAAQVSLPAVDLMGKEGQPWQISAKTLSYNQESETFTAQGDVVISRGNQRLESQKAIYNKKTGFAEVSGKVRLRIGSDYLTCDRAALELKTQTGKIYNGLLFLKRNHYYIRGRVMEKLGPNTYRVEDCHVTTCDGERPAWSIAGSEVRVNVGDYGKVKHATFRVREFPFVYVPYLVFPAGGERKTGVLPPKAGYSSRNGVDLEVPFFWAITDQMDATLYQRYLSERGYMQGVEFRYLMGEDSKGFLLFDVLSDRKDKDLADIDDVEISPFPRTNTTRYWLRGKADQDLPHGMAARLDGDFVSDQDFLREFTTGYLGYEARSNLGKVLGRPVDERYSPLRRSALRISFDRERFSLQGGTSYYQRPENPPGNDTPQPIGAFNFQWLPGKVFDSFLVFDLDSEYDYIWRDFGPKGHRLSMTPKVNVPLWLGPVEFEPSFKYTYSGQWFDEDTAGRESGKKRSYEASARLLTNVERIYDFRWRRASRLKHRVWPSLRYVFRESLDKEEESPWFEPVDAQGDLNRVEFILQNFLDARLENKKGDVSYRQWVNMKLTQGYDIAESTNAADLDKEKRPFLPLRLDLTVKLFSGLDFLGKVHWNHYDEKVTFADLSLDLRIPRSGGKRDRFSLDYVFQEDANETLNFWGEVNLAYGFSIGTSHRIDLEEDHTVYSGYWVGYHRQCWGVRVTAERENDEDSITVLLNLRGLGDISGGTKY